MKKVLIAIVLAVVIVNCFGAIADSVAGLNIVMADELLSPMESVAVISVLAAVFAVIGVVVAISLFGALLIAGVAAFFALIVAGISAFWPILLVVGALLLFKRTQQNAAHLTQN